MSAETPAARVAARMSAAARAFLDALDGDQRGLALWPFPSEAERRLWFYTPTDHGGLTLGTMRPAQQRLAMRLVASGLSRAGYVTVATIIGLENVLDEMERWSVDWGRERGRDPGLYYLRVFGEPGGGGPWSWRFGGHHVSIHHLVVGGEVRASTPCFLGADPASSPLLGPGPLRPLAGAEDLGRDLVRSLDGERRARAVISTVAPLDLVGANRPRVGEGGGDLPLPLAAVWRAGFEGAHGERAAAMQRRAEAAARMRPDQVEAVRLTRAPKGVPASALTPDQQARLRALLGAYLGRAPEEVARIESAKYAGDRLGGLWFAWAGGLEPGEPHYYRVQGQHLLLEYDNAQRGADHVHSVWRDPEGDFGDDVLGRHHAAEH